MKDALLKIAVKDLGAARCLYDSKFYSQAVFYLQQSVEKTAKALALEAKRVTPDELKWEVGHNPLKIHMKILNAQIKKLEDFSRLCNEFPRLKRTELLRESDIDKQISDSVKHREFMNSVIDDEPVYMSQEDIRELFQELDELESDIKKAKKETYSVTDKESNEFKQIFSEFIRAFDGNDTQECNRLIQEINAADFRLILDAIKETTPIYLILIHIHLSLFCLSIITFPHAVAARYPGQGINPIELYSRKLPLIRLFPECVQIMEKVFTGIEFVDDFSSEGSNAQDKVATDCSLPNTS